MGGYTCRRNGSDELFPEVSSLFFSLSLSLHMLVLSGELRGSSLIRHCTLAKVALALAKWLTDAGYDAKLLILYLHYATLWHMANIYV